MSEERVHELLYSCDSRTELCEMIAGLEDENAKLRKLVRIMHGELVSCEECGYVCGGHKFDSYVRELGVEV